MGRRGTQAHSSDHRTGGTGGRNSQEAAHRGKSPAGSVGGQEIQQPRAAILGLDPGREHRPDEGCRQVRLAAREDVLFLQPVIDPFRRVPLLLRLGFIVFQDLVDHTQPRTQLRPRHRLLPLIPWRRRICQHLSNRLA